ncbi:MAG: tetraacyldisaccharide 4'-kinase [Hyphomicrobiaceae bacterium]|nr:tetraacyldisaccharide 4'-kinase [Hyphomicrobiaceae bacterium]
MPLEEPAWWYAREPNRVARLLSPLGRLWGHVARRRLARARPYRSRLPVVCIGNFTAGGTGKTPLVLHVCALLAARGEAPAALTRGYGGSFKGPYWVDPVHDHAAQVGDEALLLAAAARTLVSRNRALGARAIEAGPHATSVIVMDDGLQNPSLEKDLVIAVVDGARGFGNGRVLPAGPLRAPLDVQLALADLIVVNEPPGSDAGVAEGLRRSFTGPVLRAGTVPREDTAWLRDRPVLAWAGIGNPARFFATLHGLGADVRAQRTFRDHHELRPEEAAALLALAEANDWQLVTTEKDLVRLGRRDGAAGVLAMHARALPIRLAFAGNDGERLGELIASSLHARRAAP